MFLYESLFRLFIFLCITTTTILVVVIFTPLVNCLAPLFYVSSKLRKADAVIVLGGGTYPDGTLTPFSLEREVQGILLYKKGLIKKIIFVGNSGAGRGTDAEKMANLAVIMGVSQKDVFFSGKSTNTYFDLIEAQKIMDKENFRSGLLLTSSIHTRRSMMIAERVGLKVLPASESIDQYRKGSVDRLILFWFELRELGAMSIFKLKGWI